MAFAAVGTAVGGALGFGGVGSALFGAGASIVGGNLMSDGGAGAAAAQSAADPFASQRGQYQTMLSNMMHGGFTPQDPSYDFRFKQGQEALMRQQAASGMAGSGNAMAGAAAYGQGLASTEYQNQFARLSSLAGVGVGSPGDAAKIAQQNYATQQQNQGAFMNQLGGQLTGAINAWNQPVQTASQQSLGGQQIQMGAVQGYNPSLTGAAVTSGLNWKP